MENVKVALWGFGAMGSGIAKVLLRKKGVDIVGVCDIHPARAGRSIYELLEIDRGSRDDVLVNPKIEEVVHDGNCDICVIATDSFTRKAFNKIKFVVEQNVNVVSTAEEMSFPMAQEPELSAEMDKLAKEHGVSILGTGINPGLMMDLLAICLSGCMTDVENGTLAGHVGFAESVGMIARALGWKIDKFEQQMSAIVTSVDRKSPYGYAKAGDVAGVNMTGQGYVDGEVKIDMVHPQQIEPEMEGTHTGDYIVLEGSPEVNMSVRPEVDGGIGTIAMVVNMIPHVINARPGLKTMLDLPVPHAIMGDFRDYIEK